MEISETSSPVALDEPPTADTTAKSLGTLLAASALAACGGGGSGTTANASGSTTPAPQMLAATSPAWQTGIGCTETEASRFLAQASMGATREQIARVRSIGYSAWLDEQMNLPQTQSRWDWIKEIGWTGSMPVYELDSIYFRKLMASPDTLRQRITLALSEILVVSLIGLETAYYADVSCYLDLLERSAFGNYRTLLTDVSTSNAMGLYLSFVNGVKASTVNDPQPDENYARELLQLFTIGLVKLNQDGTPVTGSNNEAVETYTQTDITELARVLTGWVRDTRGNAFAAGLLASANNKMLEKPANHDFGTISFLGGVVSGGSTVLARLNKALDIIFAHPNVAPFIGKQLIQRLVTSNPSSTYVAAVAAVFNNDGKGVKGNLAAVVKAILLHDEARNPARILDGRSGKLREPLLRLTAWARAYTVTSDAFTSPGGGTDKPGVRDRWQIGPLNSPTGLSQHPMRSPSVFNFFRPNYVPPGPVFSAAGMVAPEFQITNETSIAGYSNFLYWLTRSGFNHLKYDYSSLLPLADNATSLLTEINVVLCAGQLRPESLNTISKAIDTFGRGNDTIRDHRVRMALFLVMQSPDFLILK